MTDTVLILAMFLFFVVCAGYLRGCESLRGDGKK